MPEGNPLLCIIVLFGLLRIVLGIPLSYANDQNVIGYKHWDDFINIQPTKNARPNDFRVHFKGQEKINDRQSNSTYEDNKWHLVLRHGLYKAQVDKAMSEIYLYFMGYSTDVDIVENKPDYYIARRVFRNFKKWREAISINNDGSYEINGYTLHPDSSLTKEGINKKFTGLAGLAVLNDFFANIDARSWNYGIQETDNELRVIVYDNELAFVFNNEEQNVMENHIDATLKNMPWYIKEHDAMVKKIAETDFSVIKSILQKNVTGTELDETRWLINKALLPPGQLAAVQKKLALITPEYEQKQYGVDHIIEVLQKKHAQLQAKFQHG